MSIEERYNTQFVASLALREKQIQQHYRPIIAVHKWFARRPGTLFRSLLVSEFSDTPLKTSYYQSHDFSGVTILDPFMGGGTPLFESNRLGCDIVGLDINPMAYWVVREELEHVDLGAYRQEALSLLAHLSKEVGANYITTCDRCDDVADVKYFLWVKQTQCPNCSHDVDLFPGYRISKNQRHPNHVLICTKCGDLNEVASISNPGNCASCNNEIKVDGPAKRGKCSCPNCGYAFSYLNDTQTPLRHRMFAIEYHCSHCKDTHKGRFFKKPSEEDLQNYANSVERLASIGARFIPNEKIQPGDETSRLLRWGYLEYKELFNERQLLGLELSARYIHSVSNERIRRALVTNFSDLLRYQNTLCRYDTMALKSLDIFSVHGFPVGLIHCESNILGIASKNGVNIGSGGWKNITSKYVKAKEYCEAPFEYKFSGRRKTKVYTEGEWIGETREGEKNRIIDIRCEDASQIKLEPATVDAIFTDPPYYSNVQYGELMEFCYVWVKKLAAGFDPGVAKNTVRDKNELTGNVTLNRGIEHFTEGLSRTFKQTSLALKPDGPFVFTYHHNSLSAYIPVAVALLDADLVPTTTLVSPAEMGGSIHISGTQSSIIDSIFVCRKRDRVHIPTLHDLTNLAKHIHEQLSAITAAGHNPTSGDIYCIIYGHLIRIAVASLSKEWDSNRPIADRLENVSQALKKGLSAELVKKAVLTLSQEQTELFANSAP